MGWSRCVRCNGFHLPAKACDPKAQLGTLAASFHASSQQADLAEATDLLRWNAAKGA